MAITAPTYDPISTAQGLATSSISAAQALLDAQTKTATATATALTSLSSAMSAFDSVLSSLTAKKSVVSNTATFSSAVGTATATTAATPGNYFFYVEQIATAHQAAYSGLPDGTDAATAGTIHIGSGDTQFSVDLSQADSSADGKLSVKELAAAINAATDNAGTVTASTMTINGVTSLVLTANRTGEANAVTVTASAAGSMADALADTDNAKQLVTAKDAIVWLGDKTTGTQLKQPSNTYTVLDGVTMTFTSAQSGGSPVSLTVGQDSTGTAANVQSFVDGWNKLIGVLAGLTSHGDATSSTAPAIFASDSGITALQSRMQAILRQKIGDSSLVAYGITAQRDGTLTLNGDRLKKQLAIDPAGLDTLLGSASMTAPTGVLGGLDKLMSQWTSSTGGQIAQRRENNTKLQATLTTKQTRLTDQYNSAYNRYLKQFTALQELQTQMNGNSSLFDALFGDKSDS